MNHLLQTICRTGIFMICAQAVIHFRPQASYEKYLKLLVSAMVLIQLFLPVSRFLFRGDGEELEKKTQAFLEGLEAEISAAESRACETDALLEQMTLDEVRRRVEGAGGTGNSVEGAGGAGNSVEGAGGAGNSRAETGGTGESGAENSRTGNSGPENAGTDIGESREAPGTTDVTDSGTIQIDRIQVEEIRIRTGTDVPK